MSNEPAGQAQPQRAPLRHVIVSVVITPNGDGHLQAEATVTVNGKTASNVQVGLVLAGDVELGIPANLQGTRHMRAVATGAVALAEMLREQSLLTLEEAIAQLVAHSEVDNVSDENSQKNVA